MKGNMHVQAKAACHRSLHVFFFLSMQYMGGKMDSVFFLYQSSKETTFPSTQSHTLIINVHLIIKTTIYHNIFMFSLGYE